MDVAEFNIKAQSVRLFHLEKKLSSFDSFSQLFLTSLFPKIFWSHRDDDVSYVGFGSLLELNELFEIQLIHQIQGKTFTPRFFGAVAYSYPKKSPPWHNYFKNQCFILPKHLFEVTSSEVIYHQFALNASSFDSPLKLENEKLSAKAPHVTARQDSPSLSKWMQMTQELLSKLEKDPLQKVVLARQTQLDLEQDLNPYHLLEHLKNYQKNGSLFSFQFHPEITFLGASPEVLFTRSGKHVKSEALAGTCPNMQNSALFKSQKDYKEFSFVTDYLSKAFDALCCSYQKEPHQVVSIGYLNHLKAHFQGKLLPHITDEHLLKSLHPTPAISGTPQREAQKYIESVEPFNRGWYSAPLASISEQKSQFIVGIRSCLASLRCLRLIAGCGIIQESDPQKEWEELETKLSPYFNYLNLYVSA